MGAEASPSYTSRCSPRPEPAADERPRCTPWLTICHYVLIGVFLTSVALFFIAGIANLAYTIVTTGEVEYSIAITGIDGLDSVTDLRSELRPTLSPVFNLTIYVKELDKFLVAECIGGHSTELIVSYRDAFLGEGAVVPRFCVPMMQDDGVAAKAWGVDVVVPWFLRDRLAGELEKGEAVLDVVVTDPRYRGEMLACKAKVGGDRCPCQFEY